MIWLVIIIVGGAWEVGEGVGGAWEVGGGSGWSLGAEEGVGGA